MLDVIGGDYVARNLKACRVGGSIVQVGVMGGGTAERSPVGQLLSRRIRWVGTVLRGRPIEEKIAVTAAASTIWCRCTTTGVLRPVIDSRYPLEAVARAQEYVASNANVGKVLLTL